MNVNDQERPCRGVVGTPRRHACATRSHTCGARPPTVLASPTPGASKPGGRAPQTGTVRCPEQRRGVPSEAQHLLIGKLHYRIGTAVPSLLPRATGTLYRAVGPQPRGPVRAVEEVAPTLEDGYVWLRQQRMEVLSPAH